MVDYGRQNLEKLWEAIDDVLAKGDGVTLRSEQVQALKDLKEWASTVDRFSIIVGMIAVMMARYESMFITLVLASQGASGLVGEALKQMGVKGAEQVIAMTSPHEKGDA